MFSSMDTPVGGIGNVPAFRRTITANKGYGRMAMKMSMAKTSSMKMGKSSGTTRVMAKGGPARTKVNNTAKMGGMQGTSQTSGMSSTTRGHGGLVGMGSKPKASSNRSGGYMRGLKPSTQKTGKVGTSGARMGGGMMASRTSGGGASALRVSFKK